MIYSLAEILKNRLSDYTWISSLNGLAEEKTVEVQNSDSTTIKKKTPVYCGNMDDCETTEFVPLIPSKDEKCLVYFEDVTPTRLTAKEGKWCYYTAQLKVVCWMNPLLLGESCNISDQIKGSFIKKLFFDKQNFQPYFNAMTCRLVEEQVKNESIFSRWSYTNRIDKLLQSPFDYFSIIVELDYRMHESCIPSFEEGTPNNCK